MARRAEPPKRRYTSLSQVEALEGSRLLMRRLIETRDLAAPITEQDARNSSTAIATRVNDAYRSVYGADSIQAYEATIAASSFLFSQLIFGPAHTSPPFQTHLNAFEKGRSLVKSRLQTSIDLLNEIGHPQTNETPVSQVMRAYEGLSLHPEISNAASQLFADGHYASAIVGAVITLNELVRVKSGVAHLDGDKLITMVFSPERPILRFNDLADQSDKDEQRGFMMMFAGAVAGLRNPRAHKLVKDDPERALEFVAYISLLAKLLDGSKKVRPT